MALNRIKFNERGYAMGTTVELFHVPQQNRKKVMDIAWDNFGQHSGERRVMQDIFIKYQFPTVDAATQFVSIVREQALCGHAFRN